MGVGPVEAFLCDTQGAIILRWANWRIDAEGKLLALRTLNIANMGAYLSTFAPEIPTHAGTGVLSSVYGFQAIYANVLGVFTNTVPVDAYRGAGRPESNYLVERLVDAAARELGSIGRRSAGATWAALGDAARHAGRQDLRQRRFQHRVLGAGVEKMDYAGFAARRAEAVRRGKRRGFGLASYLEANRRRSGPSGRKSVSPRTASSTSMWAHSPRGRGTRPPTCSSPPGDWGIESEKIRIRQGDTDTIPVGWGTGGARAAFTPRVRRSC